MVHRLGVALLCAALLLALWAGSAGALEQKKIVSTVTVVGPPVKCHKWGYMQVRLKVVKTEVTGAAKPKISIKILAVDWPVYPDHTPKSKYINAQALPLLQQETLQLQADAGSNLVNISGATQTTVSWRESLQAALLQALKP